MDRDKIKILAADIINGKTNATSISDPRIFLIIQTILMKMGYIDLVKQMGKIARQRLIDKGYMNCGEFGWKKPDEIPKMGMALKYGRWIVSDREKFLNYKFYEKQNTQQALNMATGG